MGMMMKPKKLERLKRTRRLTREEVARDREIRRKVEEEFPPARVRTRRGKSDR
jgi:hypothetical protein